MNEHAPKRGARSVANHGAIPGFEGSLYHLQKQVEAYRAQNPAACVPPGLLIAHLNQRLLESVQKSVRQAAAAGFGLTHLVLAAVDLADYAYREISVHATSEGPDLVPAVDRIIDGAQRFFEANTAGAEQTAALECARALECFGLVLITKYGSAAEVANTQLRILRSRLLALVVRPTYWN